MRVLRYEVPVDGEWHTHRLSGEVLHVAAPAADVVEFWALESGGPLIERAFRVFGTGEELAIADSRYVGTGIWPASSVPSRLVWHLYTEGP